MIQQSAWWNLTQWGTKKCKGFIKVVNEITQPENKNTIRTTLKSSMESHTPKNQTWSIDSEKSRTESHT